MVSAELYMHGNMIYSIDKEIKKNEKSKKQLNEPRDINNNVVDQALDE